MSKVKRSNFITTLSVAVVLLLAFSIFVFSSSTMRGESTQSKLSSAAVYPVQLVSESVFEGDNYGIKSEWSPSLSGNLYIWKGAECKTFETGYDSGDLVWSYGLTEARTSYTHTSVGYKPGYKFCIQIWEDFQEGIVASNPVVVQIPVFAVSAVIPSNPSIDSYGLLMEWMPSISGSVMIWNGPSCKSLESGYDPGDLSWSYGLTEARTSYTHTSVGYKPDGEYCVQLWRDFNKGDVYSRPLTVKIPSSTCDAKLNQENIVLRRSVKPTKIFVDVSSDSGNVYGVRFFTTDGSVFELDPVSAVNEPYATNITATGEGVASLKAYVWMENTSFAYSCSDSISITVRGK